MSAAEWQTGRKVAVHAQSIGRQYSSRRGVRVELRVMRREVNLAAGKRFGGRAARQVVETSRCLPVGVRIGQPVEGAPWARAAVGVRFAYPLDLPDLHR